MSTREDVSASAARLGRAIDALPGALPTRAQEDVIAEVRGAYAALRAALGAARPGEPEGQRIEGWVPNLEEHRTVTKGVTGAPLSDRGYEFYEGNRPYTQDTWTPATLIIHDRPSAGEGES